MRPTVQALSGAHLWLLPMRWQQAVILQCSWQTSWSGATLTWTRALGARCSRNRISTVRTPKCTVRPIMLSRSHGTAVSLVAAPVTGGKAITALRRRTLVSSPQVVTVFTVLAVLLVSAAAGKTSVQTPPTDSSTLRLELDGDSLKPDQMFAVLDADSLSVRLSPQARQRMQDNRKGALAALATGQRVYGWNQALGPLKDKELSTDEQRAFQRNTLLSHAAGVGPAFPDSVTRLALVLQANTMARGTMGVRPELAERFLALVNAGVIPHMPQIGPLGTADLQPMAAAGLVLIGEQAPARFRDKQGPAADILTQAGLSSSFVLEAGEALPIISGSEVLAASYAYAVQRAAALTDLAEGALALFMEATRAEASALDARTHGERRIPAQIEVAARLRALVRGSGWMTEQGRKLLGENHARVQDAVSLRAAPHILGALREELTEARINLEREANVSNSSPLVFAREGGQGYEFVMGGNWDAALMGHDIDTLNGQIADLGVLSQELSGRLLSDKWSYGLPPNLVGGKPGLNSGMVQVQTVAVALVPEMQVRAMPAGVLSRPAKFGQEDHNPMAMASLRGLHENLDRLEIVLAVQLLMSAQGIDLIKQRMGDLPLGEGTARLHAAIRRHIPPLGEDRYMTPDLEKMITLVRGPELLDEVRAAGLPYAR
jgi:histidine ammonia-lyase